MGVRDQAPAGGAGASYTGSAKTAQVMYRDLVAIEGDIARHKRAGHIEERDGKLYATQSTATEQHATV
jgi:hypothetical protein